MKVWVLNSGCYQERMVEGVFAIAEAAMAVYPKRRWKQYDDGSYGSGDGLSTCYGITPFDLDLGEMQLVPADARVVSDPSQLETDIAEMIFEYAHGSTLESPDDLARAVVRRLISDPTQTEPPKDPWDYDP